MVVVKSPNGRSNLTDEKKQHFTTDEDVPVPFSALYKGGIVFSEQLRRALLFFWHSAINGYSLHFSVIKSN